MPNRLNKADIAARKPAPAEIRLKGYREAIAVALEERGWSEADLVRESAKRGKKLDDGYLRRMLKGQRFNEENMVLIADILNLPVYIGEVARPIVTVEAPPGPAITGKKSRPENLPVPVLPISVLIQKPFRYDPWKVTDWAYVNWRAFQALRIASMACVKLLMETEEPLVRKEALICICTDTMPPAKNVPQASVWAARKGDDLVIGHLKEEENVVLLVQKLPASKTSIIASREDIIGRVCWVWHSLI